MEGPSRKLTPAQFEILEAVWSAGSGASVAEIWAAISATRAITRTTVLNLVDRLEKRGWLRREKEGGVFRYHATTSRESTARRVAGEFLDEFFDGSASSLVLSLLGGDRIQGDDLAALRRLLDEAERTDEASGPEQGTQE